MELFAHEFVANGERKTYLRLSGRFKFLKHLNEICQPSIRPSLSGHIFILSSWAYDDVTNKTSLKGTWIGLP